ncbi:hypothetical protein CRG98_036083 [Punica granatum]|uniref:Uncharacterized protein n=1 Tax=Punica granatum TaxID=22663 RepID=A0A2I0IHQ8_PUNGR|nr:hypothetical protein CRG98_036083 [Punica granatum]
MPDPVEFTVLSKYILHANLFSSLSTWRIPSSGKSRIVASVGGYQHCANAGPSGIYCAVEIHPPCEFVLLTVHLENPFVRKEARVDLLDDLFLNAEEKAGSLMPELTVLKAAQTILYLGHSTILVESFPEVYGSGLFEVFLG